MVLRNINLLKLSRNRKIKNKILEENKDTLEWLEIIRNGTKYTIRVEERIINNKIKITKYII